MRREGLPGDHRKNTRSLYCTERQARNHFSTSYLLAYWQPRRFKSDRLVSYRLELYCIYRIVLYHSPCLVLSGAVYFSDSVRIVVNRFRLREKSIFNDLNIDSISRND